MESKEQLSEREAKEIQAKRHKEESFMKRETSYFNIKADYYESYLRMMNAQSQFMQWQNTIAEAMAEQNKITQNTQEDAGQSNQPESTGE